MEAEEFKKIGEEIFDLLDKHRMTPIEMIALLESLKLTVFKVTSKNSHELVKKQ